MTRIQQFLCVVAGLLLQANASAQWVGYEFISHSTNGLQTGSGKNAQVTSNGRYVVYEASDRTLVTPNTVNANIYLYDRKTGVTELISVDNSGSEGNQGSYKPSISDNGCRVVFISASTNLVPGAGGGPAEVFVRDRCTNPPQTRVVSANAAGVAGMNYSGASHAESNAPRISSGGTYAVFHTYATNIVGGICSSCSKVVRKNLDTGAVDLVSVQTDGTVGAGSHPDVSADGSRVVFYSSEWDLGIGAKKTVWDHFLWDATQPTTLTVVSTGSNGERQIYNPPVATYDGQVHSPGISADGRYVSFTTTSGTLTPLGGNGNHQVYVKDTVTGQLSLASVSLTGGLGDDHSNGLDRPALSRNGRYVAFYSYANNLITSTAFVKPIVRDIVTNTTTLVADRSAQYMVGLSPDNFGRYVVFTTGQTTLDSNYPNNQGLYLADLDPFKKSVVDLTPILMLLLD